MNEETLPPSPNWYLCNVLACLDDHTIGYGSRNSIVIAKYGPETSTSRTPEVYVINNAHKEKITVIASSASSSGNTFWHCLASAGDDSVVKVWNWDTLTPLLANNSHMEGTKISAMDWSRVDPNLIVSADEQGIIVCWDLFRNTTQRFNFAKLVPTCLSCCPYKRDLIAVGTRSGLVCTFNLKGGGKLLHRLRGHDTDVVSLSWCPVAYNVLQSKKSKEDMLLASGAREKTIYIWRAGGDGRYETVIHLPTIPLSQEAPGSLKHRTRIGSSATGGAVGGGGWTCVSWPEPNTLLSSSLFGELVSCDLQQYLYLKSNKPEVTKLWKLVHACHGRGLFSLAYFPWRGPVSANPLPEEKVLLNGQEILENGESKSEKKEIATDSVVEDTEQSQVVWTTSQDRQMVACYWKTGKILTEFPTLGGFVYCIATSPVDSNRIALGVGDGTIRIWNLSNSTSLEITMLWQKIKDKVMALAWHPTNEGWLAYGTSEGRVGLYDVSCGKPPILFHPYHRRSVYSLCWGPPVYKTGDVPVGKNYLYSCGDGDVVRYNPEKPSEKPFNLKELAQNPSVSTHKNIQKTDIAWKPDYSLLAIGNEDGTISILAAPHLKLMHTLFAHKKMIQCLVWHPESTATDTSYSPYQHWLASSSNDSVIKVFDLSQLSKGEGEVEAKQLKQENCITLTGHTNRVVSLCWSPHIGGHLVSVSFDHTAQLWNVPAQQPLANYCSHNSYVYSCAWSPLDPDLVMTGASDFTLRIWKISKQTQSCPSERKKLKKLESKKMAEVVTAESSGDGDVKQPSKKEGGEKAATSKVSDDLFEQDFEFAKEVSATSVSQSAKRRSRRSYFPMSAYRQCDRRVQHLNNCYHLLEAANKNTSTANGEDGTDIYEISPHLGFFGDRDSVQKLLDLEVEHHISGGHLDLACHMELWKGNITDTLKEAARQRQLNDWLVSLAPMASQRLWMEMCKSYTEQLTVSGQYQKAASYLLACHKVTDAIDLLVTHNLYREALAIARCRLGPEDPTPKKVIVAWAKYMAAEGSLEIAVECLIAVGELLEATMLIRKRTDEGSLKLAALVASRAGADELAGMLACQSLKQSLLVKNWTLANEVVLQHIQLKHLKLMVSVHQAIVELLAANRNSSCTQWLEHETVTYSSLFKMISSKYESGGDEEKQEMYGLLLKDFRNNESPESVDMMWLTVSIEVALSFVSVGAKRLHHVVTALNTCYQYIQLRPKESEYFVLQLCMWLAPQGPFSNDSIFYSEVSEESRYITKSMRAYLCIGVIDWMTEYINSAEAKSMTKLENGNDSNPEHSNSAEAKSMTELDNENDSNPEQINSAETRSITKLENENDSNPEQINSAEAKSMTELENGNDSNSAVAKSMTKLENGNDSNLEHSNSAEAKSMTELDNGNDTNPEQINSAETRSITKLENESDSNPEQINSAETRSMTKLENGNDSNPEQINSAETRSMTKLENGDDSNPEQINSSEAKNMTKLENENASNPEEINSAEAKSMTKLENGNDSNPAQSKKYLDPWPSFIELLNRFINDVITKESLQYFQDCVKIKKWEREIASAVAKSRKGEPTSDNSCSDIVSTSSADSSTDGVLQKLELLKQRKQEFESNFNVTPNPFVFYCKLKNLLSQNESENCKALVALLENVWKNVTIEL